MNVQDNAIYDKFNSNINIVRFRKFLQAFSSPTWERKVWLASGSSSNPQEERN